MTYQAKILTLPKIAEDTQSIAAGGSPQARHNLESVDPAALADAIWPVLAPRIAALIDAAMAKALTRQRSRQRGDIARLLPGLAPALAPLIHKAVKHKNDVQDDAIIGIGAKVDAQDAAIQDVTAHLQRLLRHPLFRG